MYGLIKRSGQCEKQCSGQIYIFEDDQRYGDPPRYVFKFHMIGETTIWLEGMVGKVPTASEGRAMLKACHDAGFAVCHERKSGANPGLKDITRNKFK